MQIASYQWMIAPTHRLAAQSRIDLDGYMLYTCVYSEANYRYTEYSCLLLLTDDLEVHNWNRHNHTCENNFNNSVHNPSVSMYHVQTILSTFCTKTRANKPKASHCAIVATPPCLETHWCRPHKAKRTNKI